jgi:hypothetical protein
MGPGTLDRQALRTAVEFARLLELEMLGIFVEDPAVLGLGNLPFLRELRLPDHAWRAFEPERVAADLRAAAEQARKLFDQEGAAQGVTCRFEVRQGDPATLVCSLGEETDILVMAEPTAAAERVTAALERAQHAAAASSAAVLFLPPSALLPRGSVAVLAANEADPAFELASRIAGPGVAPVKAAPPEGLTARSAAASLAHALGRRHERLVVMTRGVGGSSDDMPWQLAVERDVPVLVIEPPAEAGKHKAA